MIQNVYLQNLIAALVVVVLLYVLNRSDEQKPGKSYLRTLVLVFVALSGVEFVRPLCGKASPSILKGGSQPVVQNLVPVSTEAMSQVDIGPTPF